MNKKRLLFEGIAIFLALLYYVIFIEIPEIKQSMGSSDHFINTSKYSYGFEVEIDHNTHFMYLFNKKNVVYHIFFLNSTSVSLYNQDIENLDYLEAFQKTIKILKEYGYLTSNSSIVLIKYGNVSNTVLSSFKKKLSSNNLVEEKNSNLKELALRQGIYEKEKTSILKNISIQSFEIAKEYEEYYLNFYKNQINSLHSYVFQKLEEYVSFYQIDSIDKENVSYKIETIPIQWKDSILYPSPNSWYYVKNKKITAYIEFMIQNNKYGFCYLENQYTQEGDCFL